MSLNHVFTARSLLLVCGLVAGLFAFSSPSMAVKPSDHPRLQAVYSELVNDGIYAAAELTDILAQATFQQTVLDAMTSPAEYKLTWGKYRKIFMQEERYQQGVDFWLAHVEAFSRAEQQFGVPANMIAAILGVESKFGRFKGKHKVLDSLVTLIIGFERRSPFFAAELKEFLLLSKENNLDPTEILGSYAGAVGFPQFISSSYRRLAIDFNEDGISDLINQPEDAIGSIANYFAASGWRPGEPVTSKPHLSVPSAVAELANRKRRVQYTAAELRNLGAPISSSIAAGEKLGVLNLNANETVPQSRTSRDYVVRAGDTVCQIAERHKVPCKVLFKLNKLNARGDIYRGQKLKLPNSGFKAPFSQEADAAEMPRYFFTHHNFYVITEYNHSVLYAMAVNDLAEAIQQAYDTRIENSVSHKGAD